DQLECPHATNRDRWRGGLCGLAHSRPGTRRMTGSHEIFEMLLIRVTAGVCSGRVGIDSGLANLPALVLIFGCEPKTAVGPALFVIWRPTGLLGVWESGKNGNL